MTIPTKSHDPPRRIHFESPVVEEDLRGTEDLPPSFVGVSHPWGLEFKGLRLAV